MLQALRSFRLSALAVACSLVAVTTQAETLMDVYSLARQNDAQLKAQAATAAANRETGNIYKARLLPQVSLGSTLSRTESDKSGLECQSVQLKGGDCDGVDTDVQQNTLTLGQNLINMEAWYDYKKGKAVAQQADSQYRANEQDLLVRVTDAYVNVLRALDTYQTAKAQEEAIARQLEQTKQRFNVGLIAITDVQESQASFDSARVNTLNAQGQIGIAFEAVQVLTGQPLQSVAPLADSLPVKMPEPAAQAEWEKLALENNPSLAASALSVTAARENAKARRAAHLPTLTGSLQRQETDTDLGYHPGNYSTGEDGNTVALNLHVPLYSGGGTSAMRRQAYDQQMAAEETDNNARRNVVQQTRSLQLAVTTDIQRVAAQKQAIVSAQSALDATQAGYEVGTRNIVDVLNAQQFLFQAKLAHANARYQYVLDTMRLMQVAGVLSEDNLKKLNESLQADKSFTRTQFQ